MTNQERKEKRYQRRKKKRQENKKQFLCQMPTYEQIFTFENLWTSFWLCRKEVGWKPSIQIYQQNLSTELVKLLHDLYSPQGFISRGFIEFDLCERGKMRHIKSVDIRERVVQRCFCDYYLVPLLTRNLIYDNGASLKNKGITFSLKRLQKHLELYYKKYNTNEGYILLFDFSNFFGNIDHIKLYEIVDPLIQDEKCKKLYHHLIDAFGDVGLGLGSQVSQISAVAFPNKIDQILANYPGAESNARYMDDGYVILHTKKDAIECMNLLLSESNKLNIILNLKKIKICKINRSFIYLKKRFFLNKDGQVIIRLNRDNIYKHRRRIKKLFGLVDNKKIVLNDIKLCHKSWYGQIINKFHNRKAIYDIDKQVRRLLDEYNSNYAGNKCSIKENK